MAGWWLCGQGGQTKLHCKMNPDKTVLLPLPNGRPPALSAHSADTGHRQ